MTLRVRTGYSFRAAAGMIDETMERLIENGATYAPITDRASTFGWTRWAKLSKKAGLKPLYGVELAVTESIHAKKPTIDYWTFLAIDDVKFINQLVELATSQFRYEPLLTYEQAVIAEGVIKIVGHRSLLENFDVQYDIYVGLGPACSKGYINQALKRGHRLVAVSDNKFLRLEDEGFYEVLCGRGASVQTYDQSLMGQEAWKIACGGIVTPNILAASWTTADHVATLCNARLKTATLLSPEKPLTLEQMCRNGAVRTGTDLTDPVYSDRLKRELDLIAEKKFEDYFFIVADMMTWARQRMICGPARGSSCGSLVCYLLDITTIDPLKYDLLFERFIDITRSDLPDIDVDFSDQKRHLVFEYMEQKYGRDHIARLGTVALFRPRSAIEEAGTALGVPKWLCDKVVDSLIVRSGGDSRALSTLEDTLNTTPSGQELLKKNPEIMIAARMEGHPRHFGQHAAGIVITETPVTDYVAVDARTGATMCDKKDAEELNLLKIDALGLTQLSVFEDALTMAGLPMHHLESVPLDDKAAFDVLNKGQFSGIFQFMGAALQSITNQVKVRSLEDIIAITALARPGPMASGGTNEWVKRKNGQSALTYPHPLFEPYLKNTLGIVAYQEQVMQVSREIGGLSWDDVTALRKAMSKSLGKEYFDQYGDRFKKGAIERGVPAEVCGKVWDDLCLSGDTEIENPFPSKGRYRKFTIKQLYDRGGLGPTDKNSAKRKRQKILMFDGESLKPFENFGVTYSGKKMTYLLTTESGNRIKATKEHKFLMPDFSYSALQDLKVGDAVVSDAGSIPTKRKSPKKSGSGGHNWWYKIKQGIPTLAEGKRYLKANYKKCQHCHSAPYEETHHIDMDHSNDRIDNLMAVCRKCHKKLHAALEGSPNPWRKGRSIFSDKIVSIVPHGFKDVYDIHMPAPHHNFLANGIVVHNCAYGSWAFNRSHSVAYGIISYWCAYMKAHHPFEFAAATLTHENDPEKQIRILREMKAEGFDYVPIDAELSTDKWTAGFRNGKKVLIGPIQNVKGIGPKMVSAIMSSRARGEPLPPRAEKMMKNAQTEIDSLWPIRDAVDRLMPDPKARSIFTVPTNVIKLQCKDQDYDALVIATVAQIKPRDENEQVNIAKRNGKVLTGPTQSLNLTIADDTDRIFGKVDRYMFEKLGRQIVERGRPGKALYAFKGTVPKGFRMLRISAVRYIGDMED